MTSRAVALAVFTVITVGMVDACRKSPETVPVPVTASTPDDGAQRRADSIANAAAKRRADSISAAARNNMPAPVSDARTQTELTNTLAQKVFFDYDKDDLRDDAKSVLDAKAAILNANASVTLIISGNTDERGTAEYNLALGQRRAAQVKRYLESRGVSEARLTAQSLGDSAPVASGTDEASYQQNRRAEFEAHNAGTLVRPRS
ncbi:MAG: pal [Gemmatimonadetes bacterium]|nr:pal [Gemmatimonadota bacterium]